jgi:hypothetical protein
VSANLKQLEVKWPSVQSSGRLPRFVSRAGVGLSPDCFRNRLLVLSLIAFQFECLRYHLKGEGGHIVNEQELNEIPMILQ